MKWKALKELVYLLKIPYDGTIEFQKQKLTLSDVYGKWTAMQLHLQVCATKKQFVSGLAKHLHDSLKKRNSNIFKNPLMSCALYLDPRYRSAIISNRDKTEEAQQGLLTLWRRIHVDEPVQMEDSAVAEVSNKSDSFSFEFNERDALMAHLNGTSGIGQNTTTDDSHVGVDIEMTINLFQPEPLPLDSSILEYWETMKETDNELYQLAMAIFSVPPTEVQIERDFSSLKYVFGDRRDSLLQSRLEDVLLIHLNQELFHKVNTEELEALLQIHRK